jgi:hypothetical protein
MVFFYLLIAQIWGNLISYFVLRDSNNHSDNTAMMINNSSESRCGAQFSEKEQKITNGTIVITPSTVKEIISILNFFFDFEIINIGLYSLWCFYGINCCFNPSGSYNA